MSAKTSRLAPCFVFCLFLGLPGHARPAGITDTSASPRVKVRSVGLADVRWTGGFWAERFDLCRRVMIPSMWETLQLADNASSYRNLRIAAGLEQGQTRAAVFSDGDFYKWLEAAAHVYAVTRDPELDKLMDEVIEVIGKAQESDGYISTPMRLKERKRWQDFRDHELYNMGHLHTAASIHYRATGKDTLLKIARKNADYLYKVFKPRPPELAHFGFNPSQIMGLVELYRTTREARYLELAGIFVDMRGSQPGGFDQNQARTLLRKETQAVGHAVTGPYLWAGAADVYAETGEPALWNALERLWLDVTTRKMYVTGAIGALHQGASEHKDRVFEAFGLPYELPNRTGYNETCANIANAMWNWRMLALTADARYADVMELVFYNSMLPGISLAGTEFFYTNVLRRYGNEHPLLWMDTPRRWSNTAPGSPAGNAYCCPPNVVRTIASIAGYTYGISDDAIWVNLYGSNVLNTQWKDGRTVRLKQESDYPWDGKVRLSIEKGGEGEFAISLRIPGWCDRASLAINGQTQNISLKPGTYAQIRRRWLAGDIVELNLPMVVRLLEANPLVEEARNQVAVMRGPVVYCLESFDLPAEVRVAEVAIPAGIKFNARFDKAFLGGVTALEAEALRFSEGDWPNVLYRFWKPSPPTRIPIRLIPYYAWANRGVSHMTVWLPRVP